MTNETFVSSNDDWEILTPYGWDDFSGVLKKGICPLVKITLENNIFVKATSDHFFFINGVKTAVKDLKIGDDIDHDESFKKIIKIENIDEDIVYDIVNVDNNQHKFFVNGRLLTKNCDELAYVPDNISREFLTAIQPTLSTGGKSIITSTPKSDEDPFAEIWKGAIDNTDEYGNLLNTDGTGKNGYFPLLYKWDVVPGRGEEFEKKYRSILGDSKFLQEFCCEFVTDEDTLINSILLSRIKTKDPEYFINTIRWYKPIEANKTYMVSLDPSQGVGKNNAAIQVFSFPDMEQIAEWQHNTTDIKGQIRNLMKILHFIENELLENPEQESQPEIFWSIENNNIGEAGLVIIEQTGEENFPGTFVHEKKRPGGLRRKKKGFHTDTKSKLKMCMKFKSLVESKRLTIHSRELLKELKTFVAVSDTFKAKSGNNDDLVSASLLIMKLLDHVLIWNDMENEELLEIVDLEDSDDYSEDFEPMPVIL